MAKIKQSPARPGNSLGRCEALRQISICLVPGTPPGDEADIRLHGRKHGPDPWLRSSGTPPCPCKSVQVAGLQIRRRSDG